MKITGFKCQDESGEELNSDAFGNNAAISCPTCGHPILFVALINQKGSSASHATECKGCGRSFYIEISAQEELIIVHEKH